MGPDAATGTKRLWTQTKLNSDTTKPFVSYSSTNCQICLGRHDSIIYLVQFHFVQHTTFIAWLYTDFIVTHCRPPMSSMLSSISLNGLCTLRTCRGTIVFCTSFPHCTQWRLVQENSVYFFFFLLNLVIVYDNDLHHPLCARRNCFQVRTHRNIN